jgi:hypothetical protein
LLLFLAIAAIGFGMSAVTHVQALLGLATPLGEMVWGLHIGIFIVWIPAVLVAQREAKNVPQKEMWKTVLRGCPTWMRYAVSALFGYALVNFFWTFLSRSRAGQAPEAEATQTLRGFSGHWMLFYGAAFAILYSHLQLRGRGRLTAAQCAQGHDVSPSAKSCDQCGAPVSGRGLSSAPKEVS